MAQNNNPFAEAFKSFDAFKNQVPAFDLNDAAEQARKNIESLVEINKLIAEGAQNVVSRQLEIAQANAEAAVKAFKDVAASKDPKEAAAKQADAAKAAVEKSVSDASEIIELASKSNSKAADLIGKQVSAGLKELNKAAKKPASPKAA